MFERESQRIGERRRRAFSTRPIAAVVLALFVILQGLTAIAPSVAGSVRDGGDANFVVSLLGVTCAVDAHRDDNSHPHERGRSQCCVLCCVRDFDGAALPGVGQISGATASLRVTVSIRGLFSEAPTMGPPIGWTSSWSSQAPPCFS